MARDLRPSSSSRRATTLCELIAPRREFVRQRSIISYQDNDSLALRALEARISRLAQRLIKATAARNDRCAAALARLQSHLNALNPRLVLERGYAMVQRKDGSIVRDAAQVDVGEMIDVSLARGGMQAQVTRQRKS